MSNELRKRRSIWATIKRWFGNKAEEANDAMDNEVPVEVQLERHIKEMRTEQDRILNDRSLMELTGTLEQVSDELKAKRKKLDAGNYEVKIQQLVNMNKEEEAMRFLTEKEDLEEEIESLKESKVEYTKMNQQVKNDLERLKRDIEESTKSLRKMKTEHEQAKKKEEMYALMNKVSSIATNADTTGIKEEIDKQKRIAYGTQSEYNRRNASKAIDEDLRKVELKSKLDAYKNK